MFCRVEQNLLFQKNICWYDKNAKVEFLTLEGSHVAGSTNLDNDGEYPVVKAMSRFINSLNK